MSTEQQQNDDQQEKTMETQGEKNSLVPVYPLTISQVVTQD